MEKRIYFFYGENSYGINKKVDSLKKRFVKKETLGMNFQKFSGKEINIKEILAQSSTLSFEGEKVVWLSHIEDAAESEIETLKKYLKNPLSNPTFIITANVNKKNLKSLKELVDNPYIQSEEFKNPKGEGIIRWIKEEMQNRGLSISDETSAKLADICNNDMESIENVIKKIEVYLDRDSLVTNETIEEIVGDSFEKNIYDFVNAFFERDKERTLKLLSNLKTYAVDSTKLIGALGKELETLLKIKSLANENLSDEEILSRMGIDEGKKFIFNRLKKNSNRWKRSEIIALIKEVAEIDYLSKSTSLAPILGLEKLILERF